MEVNFFDQPVKSDIRTYDNIRKSVTGQGDTTQLQHKLSNKKQHKLIAIDLSKQQALDAELKSIQQINFTGNLDRDNGATVFFITEVAKETVLDLSQGTVKVF